MAIRTAIGYALRSHPLGEADLIVEFFTHERGRIRAVARSARRIKSRFGSAFEPFTCSRMVYFQRDKDDLGRVSSCEIERSYFEVLAGLDESAAAAYMAELIIGFAPEQDRSPKLFRLIGAVLEAIESGVSVELALRYFEVWTLRLSGLLPDLNTCGQCGRALDATIWATDSTLELICGQSCSGLHGRRRLPSAAYSLLVEIVRQSPRAVAAQDHSGGAVRALAEVTELLICGHLDRVPRSLRYMRRMRRHLRTVRLAT